MAKFRKKPIIIEAEQFFMGKGVDGVIINTQTGAAYIETLEGRLFVTHKDWIITGIKGEKYPCKPDIFEETYEAVEDE